MAWWMWMVLGLVLAVAEAQIPTNFFLLAFGIGALIVGALAGLGWVVATWLHWLLFSLLSIGALVLLQRTLAGGERSQPWDNRREVDNLLGEVAVILEEIPPGGIGRAELRGSSWAARHKGAGALERGTRARVDRVEGLTLWLRPEP